MFYRHGMYKHPLYAVYKAMKNRCYSPNNKCYKYYGGRGIEVCERWRNSIKNFVEDMGEKPSKKHTLDRIDNNGHYTPENCKWSTMTEQSINKRNTIDTSGSLHGTVTAYINRGCKCEKCKKAVSEYRKASRLNKKKYYSLIPLKAG